MPAFSRSVFLSLQAAALLAAVGPSLAPLPAVAAPVPMSHIADYASQPPARTNATLAHVQDLSTAGTGKDDTVVDHTSSDAPSMVRRLDGGSVVDLVSILDPLIKALNTIPDLGLDALPGIATLEGVLDNLRQLGPLNDVGQQKGLANYDPNNELETLLKNLVNALKYLLNDVVRLFDSLNPPLGVRIPRIVYLVKCIVDAVLNSVENITDGVINNGVLAELQEVLAQLSAQGLSTGGGGVSADGLSTEDTAADGLPAGELPAEGMLTDGLPVRRTLGYAVRL